MSALRDTAPPLGLALVGCGGIAWPHAAFAHHVAGHEAGFWQPEWPVLAILIASLWFYLRGVLTAVAGVLTRPRRQSG